MFNAISPALWCPTWQSEELSTPKSEKNLNLKLNQKGVRGMNRHKVEIMIRTVSMGFLFLILGAFALTYAQEEKRDQETRPQKQDQQARPEQDQRQQPQEKGQQERQQEKGQQEQPRQEQVKGPQERQPEQEKPKQDQHVNQQVNQQVNTTQKQQPAKSLQKKPITRSQQPQKQTTDQQGQKQENGVQKEQAKGQQEQQKQPQAKSLQKQSKTPQGQQPATALQKQQVPQASQKVQRVQKAEQPVVWQQHRAHSWQSEHRTWQQRGGYNGYRIPDDHFHGYFGSDHGFRIYSLSLEIFGGYPRFQYEGYWFSVVDPWPEYWPDNWYENDDVYIDYFGDGYYLYNRRYPRDRIAVIVYMN
jgi:hypothetical protein